MLRFRAVGPKRYSLCPDFGAIHENLYRGRAILEHHWHDAPEGGAGHGTCEDALETLGAPGPEEFGLWTARQVVVVEGGQRIG